MEQMYTMLLALMGNQQIITAKITPTDTSPNRTARKQDSTNDKNMANSCPSPPPKLIHLSAHPDEENGAQME
jgi:hypothetical protein